MDTALLLGAFIASLGIAAFGFLYFVSKDEDSYDKDARAKEKLIPEKTKNSTKAKKVKKGKFKIDLYFWVHYKSLPTIDTFLDKKPKAPKKKSEAEPEVEEVAAEPVEVVKPVEVAKPVKKEKSPAPAPVVPEPAAKAAAPAKKSNKNDLVIPAGKISDEEAENVISAIVKKLGGRVPKGSKVTLASNVDNLKVW